MRMIVEAFKDSLELGLAKPEQIVVSTLMTFHLTDCQCFLDEWAVAYDPHIRLRMAHK